MSTARARSRAEPAPDAAPTHTAKLVRGLRYDLIGHDGRPDMTFTNGMEVAVSQEVFDHLAEHALDRVTLKEGGRVTAQLVRKFALRGPSGTVLPKIHSETVTVDGGEVEVDEYA